MIANRTELARILGVTEASLRTWRAAGMPALRDGKRGRPNQYDTAQVIEWMIQRALGRARTESERERRERLEADRLELLIAKETGQLVSAAEIGPLWALAIDAVRGTLTESASTLKSVLDDRYGLDVDVALLQAEVDGIVSRLIDAGLGVGRSDGG